MADKEIWKTQSYEVESNARDSVSVRRAEEEREEREVARLMGGMERVRRMEKQHDGGFYSRY